MYDVPVSLSPSRVEAFTSCPMAFRFASIEKLPEPPGIHMTRGSLVHRALELFFMLPATARTAARLETALDSALIEYRTDPDFTGLALGADEIVVFEQECRELIGNYLRMEDPTAVREIGLELRLSAQVDALTLEIVNSISLCPFTGWKARSTSRGGSTTTKVPSILGSLNTSTGALAVSPPGRNSQNSPASSSSVMTPATGTSQRGRDVSTGSAIESLLPLLRRLLRGLEVVWERRRDLLRAADPPLPVPALVRDPEREVSQARMRGQMVDTNVLKCSGATK